MKAHFLLRLHLLHLLQLDFEKEVVLDTLILHRHHQHKLRKLLIFLLLHLLHQYRLLLRQHLLGLLSDRQLLRHHRLLQLL